MGRFWLGVGVALAVCSGALAARAQTAPLPDSEHFALSVHARATRATARAEQAAWLSLTLPLDRLAAPRAAVRAAVAAPAVSDQSAAAEPPDAPVSGSTDAQQEPQPSVSFEQLQALSEFSRRASVVALAVAGAAADRRRLDSLSARSRASAALPELRLRAQRNTDQALRWAPTSDDPYRVTQADGAGTTFEASATFRLDRLLFSREELVVERLRAQAGAERIKLEQRVLAAVLGLFRARELACVGDAEEGTRTGQLVRGVELATELDVLTAGWFSEEAPHFGRAVWGFPEAVLGQCRALAAAPQGGAGAPPTNAAGAPAAAPAAASTKPVASLEESE